MTAVAVAPATALHPDDRPRPDPRRISGRDHVYGEPHGLVQVVIYGDLNSRRTAAAYRAVHDAAFRYRCIRATLRYLLLDGDAVARTSAAAAEAVAPLGVYWPFVDEVFRSGADPAALRRHCRALDVDEHLVDAAVALPRSADRFAEDRHLAALANVGPAPTTFINGVRWRSGPETALFGDLCRLAELTRPLWAGTGAPRPRRRP